MAVDVEIIHPFLQMHGEDQTHKSQVMIAVKVTYEDMVDPVKIGLQFH